jgi:molybdate transport repressor ModE-like protein
MSHPLDLDPRSLVVLHHVDRAGSLSGAARALGWSHPAVAQHVRRLEALVGQSLVARAGRGVTLTEAGRVAADAGAEIAAALTHARAGLADVGADAARVRVVAFPTACATLLVDAHAALAGRGEALRLDIREAEPDDALAALEAGEVDLAVTFHDEPPRDPRATVLGRDAMVVVLPLAAAAADAAAVDIRDLADETVIAGCPACQRRFTRHAEAHGIRPLLHPQVTDDYVLMQAMAAVGQGAAVLPRLSMAAHRRDGVEVRELTPRLVRHVAVWRSRGRRAPAADALAAALVEAAARSLEHG